MIIADRLGLEWNKYLFLTKTSTLSIPKKEKYYYKMDCFIKYIDLSKSKMMIKTIIKLFW